MLPMYEYIHDMRKKTHSQLLEVDKYYIVAT